MTTSSSEKAPSVASIRAPRITMPESVSRTALAARSIGPFCSDTSFERSTCGLVSEWVVTRSFSRTSS